MQKRRRICKTSLITNTMEEPSKIENLANNVKEYVNIQVEIVKLNALNKISIIGAKIAFGFIAALMTLLLLLFGSMALGYYLSTLTGSTSTGFLLVTGFYLIIGILLYSNRKSLVINPIRNLLIRQILSDEE
jgi:hypothetical protein